MRKTSSTMKERALVAPTAAYHRMVVLQRLSTVIAIVLAAATPQNASAAAFVTTENTHAFGSARRPSLTTTRLHYFHPHFPSFESLSGEGNGKNANADLSMNVYELERARTEFEHLLEDHSLPSSSSIESSSLQPAGAILPSTDTRNQHGPASSSISSTTAPTTAFTPPSSAPQSNPPPFPQFTSNPQSSSISSTSTSSTSPLLDEDDNVEPCMMLLTNAARRFRELELSYLHNLRDADDSVESLIHLWTTERDEIAAHALLSWQSGRYECSDGLVAEQVALTTVCRTHPGWADPWARLATLHYYQGRMEEALSAAEHAASVKPWHFEALNVGALVLSWARREADSTATSSSLSSGTSLDRSANNHNALATRAAGLARHVLPPLTPQDGNQARHMWVDRAVALASSQLQCAEEANEAARAEWLVHQGQKSTSTHSTTSSTTENGHKPQSKTPSPMSQQQHVSAASAAAAFQAKFMLNDSEIWQ